LSWFFRSLACVPRFAQDRVRAATAAITAKTPRAGDGGGAYNLGYVIDTMMDGCGRARLRAESGDDPDRPDG
jgi:hypothetical protein